MNYDQIKEWLAEYLEITIPTSTSQKVPTLKKVYSSQEDYERDCLHIQAVIDQNEADEKEVYDAINRQSTLVMNMREKSIKNQWFSYEIKGTTWYLGFETNDWPGSTPKMYLTKDSDELEDLRHRTGVGVSRFA